MDTPAIKLTSLKKRYGTGDAAVDALKGVDMTIWPGEVVGLVALEDVIEELVGEIRDAAHASHD